MDIQNLTSGEITQIEKLLGRSMSTFQDPERPQAEVMAAFAYLIKRREDKTFTWEQAQAMTLAEINALISPDEAAGE